MKSHLKDKNVQEKSNENDWVFTKNKLPKENYTVKIYGLRKKSEVEHELIEGFYEDGKFLMFNETSTDMEEVDSVYAWKYRK